MKTANFTITDLIEFFMTYDSMPYPEAVKYAIVCSNIYESNYDNFVYSRYEFIAEAHELNLTEQALNQASSELFKFSCVVDEIVELVKEPELTPEEIEDEAEFDAMCEKIAAIYQSSIDNWNDPCSLLVA